MKKSRFTTEQMIAILTNQLWSPYFVEDALTDGRQLRTLSHQCSVVIRLIRDHQSDEFHWATFTLFDSINRHIGQVKTIEGVKYEQ